MNKFFLILVFLVSASFATTNLDSLLSTSKATEQKTQHIGFLAGNGSVKKAIGTPNSKGFRGPINIPNRGPDITIKNYFQLLKDVDSLKNNQEKITQIITSLQTQSSTHADNSDFVLKLLEIVITALVTIVVGYITAKITGKKS